MKPHPFSLPALLSAALCAGCATNPAREGASPPPQIVVMSYNIRIGAGPEGPFGSDKAAENLAGIAGYITQSGADFVLLQEVDRRTGRVKGVDELDVLATATGMHPAWGRAMDVAGGEYGIAILSRHPLRDVRVHPLFRPDYSKSHPDWPGWYAEQRVALSVVADTPDGPVHLVNTHLGVTEDQRVEQMQQLAGIVDALPGDMPIIVGGDLNAPPTEPSLIPLRTRLTDAWTVFPPVPTFSATKPDRTIDYLFVNRALTMTSVTVDKVMLSDHLPVVVVAERVGPAAP